MHKFFRKQRLITNLFIAGILLLLNSFDAIAAGTCDPQGGTTTIGLEYTTDTCPPANWNNNTTYHYIVNAIKCIGGKVSLYASYGDYTATPAFLTSVGKSQNYKVLRNTKGNHFIFVHSYYNGLLEGIDMGSYSSGQAYYDVINTIFFPPAAISEEVCDGKDNDCDGEVDEGCCTEGQTKSCYTGTAETKNVGICKAGTQTCTSGQWGACEGEVLPAEEICGNNLDDDCDGQKDEGCCPKITSFTGSDTVIDPTSGGTISFSFAADQSYDSYEITIGGEKIDGSTWDGKINGKVVEPGTYTATLTIKKGDCTDSESLSFKVESTEDCKLRVDFGSSANIASGNLNHSQTLFTIPNSRLMGDFTLSYNSLDSYNGVLGIGWTHTYNIILRQNNDDSYTIMEGDGGRLVLYQNGGYYTPETSSYPALTKNADGTYHLYYKDGTSYIFNQEGKITSISDRNSNAITFTYDSNNNPESSSGQVLTGITDPSGRNIYLSYDANGRISAITDLNSNTYTFTYTNNTLTNVSMPNSEQGTSNWSYTYDSDAFMLSKTDTEGYTTTYLYDEEHRIKQGADPEGNTKTIFYNPETTTSQLTDSNGAIWTYKYNPSIGALTEKTDPDGNTTTYAYDSYKNLISTTEPDGSVTSYTYDEDGNMTSATDAAGNVTSYTYNQFGEITSIKDPEGNITQYTYDDKGNLTSMTDATGAVTYYQYDSSGNVTSITNANGQTTTFAYDSYNNLISITDPTGAKTTFTYDSSGNMLSQTDASGNTTRFEYNSLNQLIKVIDPDGNITQYTYDSKGNRTSVKDANGNITYYEYNHKGQLTKVTDAIGNITQYTYGGSGCSSCGGGGSTSSPDKLTSITDANGRVTTYQYDTLGRLIREIDPIGNTINYTYDARGRLTSVTDPIGNITTYEYDQVGRIIKTNSPDTGITTYAYDSVGNLLTKTDAIGITTTYSYDALNRITLIQFPDSSQNITYTYDNCTNGIGRLCTMTDPSATTAYEYDTLGSVTRENHSIYGITYTTSYEYDKTGNITAITYPSGRKISYTYNNIYRPTSVTQQLNKGTKTLSNNFMYDKIGKPLSMTLGNGLIQQWTYDPKNRISTIYVPNIVNLNYTYDSVDNITAITDYLNSSNTKTYSYDALDRLIAATGSWGNLAWAYDANGNRLTQQNNAGVTNYSYQSNQLISSLTSASTSNYSYDSNGNTISDSQREYVYNQNQRLIKVVENGKTVGEYTYNGKGQRVIKKTGPADTSSSSSQNTIYHYDFAGRLIEETAGNGKLLVDYVYLDSKPLAMIRKQGNNDETFYYHNDHLGTPKIMTDKLAKIVWNIEFDPFGNEIEQNGRHGTYIRNVENNLRFPGQYYDKDTGLHQNGWRDYHPMKGGYWEADPIGIRQGRNHLYNYAQLNPLRFIDPSGLTVKLCKRDLNLECDPSSLFCPASQNWYAQAYHSFISVNGETFGFTTNDKSFSAECWIEGPGDVDHNLWIDQAAEIEGYIHGSCKKVDCCNENELLNNLKNEAGNSLYYYCLNPQGGKGINCQAWANMKINEFCK